MTSLADLLTENLARYADRPAVITPGGSELSYAELSESVAGVRAALRESGVRDGSVVAVCLPRSAEFVAALLGVLTAGVPCVPIDPTDPPHRLRSIIASQRADLVIARADQLDLFDTASRARPVGGGVVVAATGVDGGHLDPSARLVFATSGSTGAPKGVMLDDDACVVPMRWAIDAYGFHQDDRHVFKTSTTFVSILRHVLWPLCSGGSLIVVPPGDERDLRVLLALMREYRPTVSTFFPSGLRVITRLAGDDPLTEMRLVLAGGEELTSAVQRAAYETFPQSALHNLYACTEAPLISSAYCPPGYDESAPIGTPIDPVRVVLSDQDGDDPEPDVGEIVVGGSAIALGYSGNVAEADHARFHVPADGDVARWYRTGDIGRRRDDGGFEFHARAKHLVKLRGYRIDIGEIESVLHDHPEVEGAVVSVIERGGVAAALVAHVVYVPGASVADAGIDAYLGDRLPGYMLPTIRGLDRMPLMFNGKPDRVHLRKVAAGES